MLLPTEKIKKFVSLEATRGYNNRSVVGGLDRYLPKWQKEASAAEIPLETIETVSRFLSEYRNMNTEQRAEAVNQLLTALGDKGESPNNSVNRKAPPKNQPVNPQSQEQKICEKEDIKLEENSESIATRERRIHRSRAKTQGSGTLDGSVEQIPGIGSQNAKALAKQGVDTVRDLLYYFPRRYDDYSQFKTINKLSVDEQVSILCVVHQVDTFTRGRYQITKALIGDGTGKMRLTWFNQPWIAQQLKTGSTFVFSGKVDSYLGRPIMNSPEFEPVEKENLTTNRIVPIYSVNAALRQNYLRRMIFNTIKYWADKVVDFLPPATMESADLLPLPRAIEQIHFPSSASMLREARRRLSFDEIFLLQLSSLKQKKAWKSRGANRYHIPDVRMDQWLADLPYKLTDAQMKVLNEIRGDIDSGLPMNRLIQGDVGSGKTIVACLASIIIADQNGQTAIMAPTGILAEQHMRTYLDTLERMGGKEGSPSFDGNRVALLIGSTPESEKQSIRERLASGEIMTVIGTHALLEDPVQFRNLELAVIDEQHRFGVDQRSELRSKGASPHLAVMTATPIPRSLSWTIYGDLDLSVIDQMPKGRLPVKTYLIEPLGRERVYKLIVSEVKKGNQAFIIYPLVESGEDETREDKAAVDAYEKLSKEIFPNLRLALLHGRMKGQDKEDILQAFRNQEFDILVSTSVIEVGVDVPNATVMLIEGADRFGLAQLHQFRGRVGRGSEQAYCILIPEKMSDVENDRLSAMTKTNDGFELAEYDLQKRGPGDFFGTRQSGMPEIKIAMMTDARLIESARIEAEKIFAADPDLTFPDHQELNNKLTEYPTIHFGDIS
ncbi:MAG: ATP-dependent DNA helicase RecG [Chloroflexi bacterium]|nr:ATP-dependent DNA helicase RecG [Chloroflexota bacterium]